jgi:hypothetical protein
MNVINLLISIILSIVIYIAVFFFVIYILPTGSGESQSLNDRMTCGSIIGLFIISGISFVYMLSGVIFISIIFGLFPVLYIIFMSIVTHDMKKYKNNEKS